MHEGKWKGIVLLHCFGWHRWLCKWVALVWVRDLVFDCLTSVPEGYLETVGGISFSDNDGVAIFVNFDIVFVEKGYAVVIAELADGDEGAGREAVEDVSGLCFLG